MRRIWIIFRRELKELRKNRTIFQTMAVMPVLLVLFPMAAIFFFNFMVQGVFSSGAIGVGADAECLKIGAVGGCTQADILPSLLKICFSFFLPVPAVLPMMIAAYSVVIEKERRSLEPLLVTPVSTLDLLLGKSLSALIPAVLINWLAFAALLLLIRGILQPAALNQLELPLWGGLILLWTPLMAGISTLVGVAISSRARDARAAQQLGSLVVLPEVLLVLGMAVNIIQISWQLLIAGLVIGIVANIALVYLALNVFERENILTRWR